MQFDIISVFPKIFESVFKESLIQRAQNTGILKIRNHDLRAYTLDKHKRVDDYPFGGGVGMILMVEPIARALESIKLINPNAYRILLSPSGNPFDQKKARELSKKEGLILVCGRYEGVDHRISEHFVDEELSIGDYVLSGGEIPAMVVVESVARLIPGVVGDSQSIEMESFETDLLEYPQYTRPREFRGYEVPDVLTSGNQAKILEWQKNQALQKTARIRPDLLNQNKIDQNLQLKPPS